MKKEYRLTIELLSDLCVSDGGVYNSTIDTDICYDEYGFPYIPAKRIKGCLRECGLELLDWDDDPTQIEKDINFLFGKEGEADNRAKLHIGNAYLTDYEEKVRLIRDHSSNPLFHPQNVLDYYSYVRSQTAMDYETGVAEDDSLRTMRVANRGLAFSCAIEMEDDYAYLLQDCCAILRHMGVSRTRGLGEVKVTMEEKQPESNFGNDNKDKLLDNATVLNYEIELCEPLICKSVNAGEAYTLDYIEGSKVLGLISEGLKASGRDYIDFVSLGKLICSNAYISVGGTRAYENPGFLYTVKNQDDICINKLYETDERKKEYAKKQLNQLKHGYIVIKDGNVIKGEVDIENRYHHRRPDDKAIGRAMQTESDSEFYQMSSISRGQVFEGFVSGTVEQIKIVYDIISSRSAFHLGYASSSEYGLIRMRVKSPVEKENTGDPVPTRALVAMLESPTIIYGKNAMATTDPSELIEEVKAVLGIKNESGVDTYLRYTTVGGYNVTWNKRKPTLMVFDKGTALAFHFDKPIAFPSKERMFIGERTTEGYGEITIEPYNTENDLYSMKLAGADNKGSHTTINIENNDFLTGICEETMIEFIKDKAATDAQNAFGDRREWKPTISNMVLLLNECVSMEEVNTGIEDRFKDKRSDVKSEKLAQAKRIISETEKNTKDIAPEFSKKFKVEGLYVDEDYIKMKYLKAYLMHAKYMLRRENV